MDMTLSFYYYYLFLNELFKKNEQKKFDKKKKQAKQTNKYKTKQKSSGSCRRYILQIQVWLATLSKYA